MSIRGQHNKLNLVALAISIYAAVHASAVPSKFFYTGPGTQINVDACPTALCAQCSKGFYNLGCANATNGTCTPCPPTPTNTIYDNWGAYPDGILSAAPLLCPFVCKNSTYIRSADNQSCIPGNCAVLTLNNTQYIASTTFPSCQFECKSGYVGNSAINPSTCTLCPPGQWSLYGAVTCTLCLAGQYQPNGASTKCNDCTYGIDYTITTGQAACVPCTQCATGQWRNKCGGNSSGTCAQCTNVV